jgi:ribosomal protein L11 methyltransferase
MPSHDESRSSASGFARIEVRVRDRESGERLAAEAYDAGALGLEERDEPGAIALTLYAPLARAAEVAASLRAQAAPDAQVIGPEEIAAVDWAEAWKVGLRAVEISPRLRIRPSFAEPAHDAAPTELVIDPGQAFGTGSHSSTRLALEWVDALAPRLAAGARILDVGCGTGVLALAALRLSRATRGVALDLDPEAARAARANALRNGLAARLDVLRGPLAALRRAPFELVVANLLRTELLPLADAIALHTARGGLAVLSGLLESERGEVERALARAGLAPRGARVVGEPGGERWLALLTGR